MLMIWQPSRRIWAGEDLEIDERELEEPMEGIESTGPVTGEPSASGSAKDDNQN